MLKKIMKPIISHPADVILLLSAITALLAGVIATNARVETNLDMYMPKSHPAFVYSAEAEKVFGIRDGIMIAIEHPESAYNPGTLQKIVEMETALAGFSEVEPGAIRSIHTSDNIVASDDGLDVRRFYSVPPETDAECSAIRADVEANPMIAGRLVSRDGRTALIIAEIKPGSFSRDLYARIQTLAQRMEGPETIHVAGRPIVEGTLALLGPADMKKMGPAVLIVIAIALFLMLRTAGHAAMNLLVVMFSTIWAFGLMVLCGIPVYTVTIMIPVMLIAIGVAYGVHISHKHALHAKENPEASRADIVVAGIRELWKPVLFAALTTAAGFLSLITSQVYPVKYFGLFSAFGVLAAMGLSFIMISAATMLFGPPLLPGSGGVSRTVRSSGGTAKGSGTGLRVMVGDRFADQVMGHPLLVVGGALLVVAISLFGVSKVWINSSFLANFEKTSAIARTDAFVNANFGGTSTLNLILEAREPDTFKNPEVLALMDRIQGRVGALEHAGGSFSLADYLKRMNDVMTGSNSQPDGPLSLTDTALADTAAGGSGTLPDTREMTAQYLLLYEMSGDPANLAKVVDFDYRQANVTFQLKGDDSRTIQAVLGTIESFRNELDTFGIQPRYAGSGYKSLVFSDLILKGQISSLGLSLVIVIGLVAFMFRNLILGLIASIPVIISSALNFGIMGLLGIPLSTSTALISSIAVGIGIDYSIHLTDRYMVLRSRGYQGLEAGRRAMSETGRAVLLNATVVICGFLVLLLSAFPPNRQVGALVSLNMAAAFAATITITFLFVRKYDDRKQKGETSA